MSQNEPEESIQHCFGEFNQKKQVVWENLQLQHKSKNAQAYCYKPPTQVVPVIFLPGIMGSNLRHKKNKKSIWRVRSSLGGKAWDALGWVFTSANKRRELLDPETTETDFTQSVDNDHTESTYFANSRQARGWGSALGFSYFEPLEMLQKELLLWENQYNQAKKNGEFSHAEEAASFKEKSIFSQILGQSLSAEDDSPLAIEETSKYRNLLLPLHVFGYNWLQDNSLSAQQLANYIDDVLKMYNVNENGGFGHGLAFEKGQGKVILVTHSMGGLVSRYASELLEPAYKDKILGIVHGVMPDLGSPTAYKMMKIGEQSDFAMGLVLGASAKRLMSVLAQSPAALQLLPSPKYNHGKPWLRIEKGSPDGVTDLLLPQNGDPFEEVYLQDDVWWRMYEPDILDRKSELIDSNLKKYKKIIRDTVKPFIQNMNNKYHMNTYQFYGAYFDENDPKDSRRSDETVTWKLQDKTSWLWVSDDSRSTNQYGDKREYSLIKSSNQWQRTDSGKEQGAAGDGTVPALAINLTGGYKEIIKTNVGHQSAYQFAPRNGDKEYKQKGEVSPAIKFTLRSICRILQTDEVKS